MSLYNTLFGVNNRASVLLSALGLNETDIPRFRDCYLRDNSIVIYTRTGGGNRDYYDQPTNDSEYMGPFNEDLRGHPNYITDHDCDFDSTYLYFYFSFPEDYKDQLTELSREEPSATPSEKWKALTEAMTE